MAAVGAAELAESLCPPANGNIPVGLYVPLLEFNPFCAPMAEGELLPPRGTLSLAAAARCAFRTGARATSSMARRPAGFSVTARVAVQAPLQIAAASSINFCRSACAPSLRRAPSPVARPPPNYWSAIFVQFPFASFMSRWVVPRSKSTQRRTSPN